MRQLLGNIATLTIAGLLLAGAVLFAWVRSAQVTFTTETAAVARFAPEQGDQFRWEELGKASYDRNCQNCHGSLGGGWDQYPAIGHTARLFAAPGGRDYLIDVHLYGLTSDRWRAPMPPMGHMPDVELAATLNHVLSSYGNEADLASDAQLYTPADIAARRGLNRTPSEVNRHRPTIEE